MHIHDPDLQATRKVLGSYSPYSALLQFNYSPGTLTSSNRLGASFDELVATVPPAVLTHELAHFVQSCGTAHGLRRFFLGSDLLDQQTRVLTLSVRATQGSLLAPLLHNLDQFAMGHTTDTIHPYLLLARAAGLQSGGLTYDDVSSASPYPVWPTREPRFYGLALAHPVIATRLDDQHCITLGAVHLEEGFAKAVEMIRRAIEGDASGDRAMYTGSLMPMSDRHKAQRHPYFIANEFWALTSQMAGVEPLLEEFCAVVDLALMMDPATLLFSDRPYATELSRQALPLSSRGELNPFHTFTDLAGAWLRVNASLPRLTLEWDQDAVTAYQNRLLEAAGVALTMHDLTTAAVRYAENGFALIEERFIGPPELLATYRNMHLQLLLWRRDVLRGGAILADLLTDMRTLRRFAQTYCPAAVVGGTIISFRGDYVPGQGIGVAITHDQAYRDTLRALLHGNERCRLDKHTPRFCPVPVHDVCGQLPAASLATERCVREQMIAGIRRATGMERLQWTQ